MPIFHRCEDLVPILHTCKDLVPLLQISENLVPIAGVVIIVGIEIHPQLTFYLKTKSYQVEFTMFGPKMTNAQRKTCTDKEVS